MTSVNWADLMDSAEEGGGNEALPPDEYEVVITDSSAKVASTGRNMIEVKFRVESGPYKGKPVYNNFVIVPENATAKRIFFQNMSILGLNTAYFAKNPSLEQAAEDLVEKRCRIRVSVRTYGGRERNQVDGVFPPASPNAPVEAPGSGSSGGPGSFAPPPFQGEPPF